MRLPNGYGSVTKLSGKRRNPYCAKKFIEWKYENGNVLPVYRSIGYFKTKIEALEALAEFNRNPLDLKVKPMSFKDVYQKWKEKHSNGVSVQSIAIYDRAFLKFQRLHNDNFIDISSSDYETVLLSDMTPTAKKQAKFLLHGLYDYALKHDICNIDVSKKIDVYIEKVEKKEKKVIPKELVDKISKIDSRDARMFLVGIYTGMRANEILSLEYSEVKDGFLMIKGSKTDSGKNRIIPIHPNIKFIFENKKKSGYVFTTDRNAKLCYDSYRKIFAKLANEYNPHETRHTFITNAIQSGMSDVAVRAIVGHSPKSLTEDVYTHLTKEYLAEEMQKYSLF